MYREQLGRKARPVGTVGLLPGLNTLSFETEENKYINSSRPEEREKNQKCNGRERDHS